MLEAFDPVSRQPAQPLVATLALSTAAAVRAEVGMNVRAYVDRLLAEGLHVDALTVIARSLPVQFMVAWCCECVRESLAAEAEGPASEVNRAALALSQQCLEDPSDANRQLCLELASNVKRSTAGAWLATAAAWAEGSLTLPDQLRVEAPPQAVAEAVVAALKLAAGGGKPGSGQRLSGYAARALTLFTPRRGPVS